MKKILLGIGIFMSILSATAFAYSSDVGINSELKFSTTAFMEGKTVRIYATTVNNSNQDLLGVVRFFGNDRQINGDQAVSLFRGKTDDIFIDWTPLSYGNYKVAAKYYPWNENGDDPANNWTKTNIYVVQDTDHDGTPNTDDNDDDNDGVPDDEDDFPLNKNEQHDTDGDGVGDNTDTDDDNDGVPDDFDDMPLDPNETTDTDGDGIGDIKDTDDDNDGISDIDEDNNGTNSQIADTDNDEVIDGEDAFPLNPDEQLDTDGDGIGNNIDTDDDNDGIPDVQDENPLNKGPVIKLQEDKFTIGVFTDYIFDASPSYDEDGEIVSFEWEIDGQKCEGNSIKHTFRTLGDHSVKLTITDNAGEKRTEEFLVSVINSTLYTQLFFTVLAILLAILIYLKYIARAKNQKHSKNSK